MGRKQEVFGVTVEGDISGLKKAMNEATTVFGSTERAIRNIDKALKLDPSNLDLLKKKQELCNKAIKDGEKALSDLKKQQSDINKSENFKKGVTDLSEKYTELQFRIEQTEDAIKKYKVALTGLPTDNVDSFIDKFGRLGDILGETSETAKILSRTFQTMLATSFTSAVDYEREIANIKK